MSNLSQRIDALSPERRKLLEMRLRKQGLSLSVPQQITRRTTAGPWPLSFAQERLWFLDQYEPQSPAYNVPKAFRLSGTLDARALEYSLGQVVERHEVLRTTFDVVEGVPYQAVHPAQVPRLPVIDLQELPEAEREAEAERFIRQQARQPFNLARGPVLRAALLRLHQSEHIFFLCLHHIVSDEWSTPVLFRELAALYEASKAKEQANLGPLPVQYADYALWQRQSLQGPALETKLSYWRAKLTDAPHSPLPPTDHPRPPRQTFNGARQSLLLLPASRMPALKAMSRAHQATQFMTLLAAFKVLLYRYTGQEDVVVGSPFANRDNIEVADLIGFFLNTLVLRTDLSGNPTFVELLGRVRQVTLEAFNHKDLPFEKLVAELQSEREVSHSPLFQVLFVQQTSREQTWQFPGLGITPVRVNNRTAKFDLTLFTREEPEGLTGILEYNTDLFDAATMKRLLSNLQTLLEGIVDDPGMRISSLPLLTAREQHQLLFEWNATESEIPSPACVHHLVETQAEKTPAAVAAQYEEKQLTYGDLNARANQLARFLKKQEVGPEVLVGICADRSLDMLISVLGVLKTGAAYLPLDPSLPSERLAFILEDAQAKVLLVQERLLSKLPKTRAKLVNLDIDWTSIAEESTENPSSRVRSQNLAYVLYTSGSTGRPKGVAMQHRPLYNLIQWQIENSVLHHGVRMLQFSSLGFDASFVDIFWTWCTGGTLVLISQDLQRDAASLLDFLDDQAIKRVNLPVVALQQLAEAAVGKPMMPGHLGEIVTTAEQLQITPAVANLLGKLPECTLHNQYGPTESHVVAAYTLQPPPAEQPVLPPIGRPIANTQIYLLDASLHPVPIGITGDLYIGGDSLSRGYLNRPALTAERFIPNPFSRVPGARLYRTGDLARYQPNGNIEFLGRSDSQVKIRGYRVELGEIEAILGQHPSIQHSVALVRQDPQTDNQQLVAFTVPSSGTAPTAGELQSFLKEKLPEYMVPSIVVMLERLPLTPSGKVDRRALPTPERSRDLLEDEYVAPRTAVEEALATVWSQVLGVDRIGVHDSFFELGGHSLLATQVISRTRDIFRLDVPLRTIFEAPTVAEMAQAFIAREKNPGQVDKAAQVLREIRSLKAEEMREMLQQKKKGRDHVCGWKSGGGREDR